MNTTGTWRIEVPIKIDMGADYTLTYEHDVATQEDVARVMLPLLDTYDFINFRATIEMSYLKMGRYEELAESTPTSVLPHITSTNPNPVRQNSDPGKVFHNFQVHPSEGTERFRWYVLTDAWSGDTANYYQARWGDATSEDLEGRFPDMQLIRDKEIASVGDFNAYTKSGFKNTTLPSFSIFVSYYGKYIIICEELSPDGNPTGKKALFVQIVLPDREGRQYEAFTKHRENTEKTQRKHRENIDENITKIKEGEERPIKAVYINKETHQSMALTLYYGPDANSQDKIHLLDFTPGVGRIAYAGTTINDALNDFEAGNSYPDGIIQVDFIDYSSDNHISKIIVTTGESLWQQWSSGTGWASLGIAGLGIIAALIPGGQVVAGVLFIASGVTGAASASLSLYDRLQQAEVEGLCVAIDVLSLAGSILGAASVFKGLSASGKIFNLTSKTGQFLLWADFTTDVASGVLITVDGVAQIQQVLDSDLSRGEKTGAIVRVLANLALTTGLMILSAKSFSDSVSGINTNINKRIAQNADDFKIKHFTNSEIDNIILQGTKWGLPEDVIEEIVLAASSKKAFDARYILL